MTPECSPSHTSACVCSGGNKEGCGVSAGAWSLLSTAAMSGCGLMAVARASLAGRMACTLARRSECSGWGWEQGSLGRLWGVPRHPFDQWISGVLAPQKKLSPWGTWVLPHMCLLASLGTSRAGNTAVYRCGADSRSTYTARHAEPPNSWLRLCPNSRLCWFLGFLPCGSCILRPEHVVGFDI